MNSLGEMSFGMVLGSRFEGELQNFQILEGFLEKSSKVDMWGKISGFFP